MKNIDGIISFGNPNYAELLTDIYTPPLDVSAVVFKDSNKVYALSPDKLIDMGKAGEDDAKVIQSALNSLTPGRTWKEKVVLLGEFIVNTKLIIPSYTIFVFDKIVASNNFPDDVIITTASAATNVEIINGEIDGDKLNQNHDINGINFVGGVTYCRLHNVYVHDCYKHGVFINGSKVIVENCKFDNNGRSDLGVWAIGCGGQPITDSVFKNITGNGNSADLLHIAGTSTIYNYRNVIETVRSENNGGPAVDVSYSYYSTIKDVISRNEPKALNAEPNAHYLKASDIVSINSTTASGLGAVRVIDSLEPQLTRITVINSAASGIDLRGCNDAKLLQFYIESASERGILLNLESRRTIISQGTISKCNGYGLYWYQPQRGTIRDVYFIENGQGGVEQSALVLDGGNLASLKTKIVGCVFIDAQTTKTQLVGIEQINTASGNCWVELCEFYGINTPISLSGTTNYLRNNVGYTTENSGTASITGDGVTTTFTIPHGLVSTPSYVNVLPKAGAPTPSSIDVDATNITLTFSTAPATGTYYYWWEARV